MRSNQHEYNYTSICWLPTIKCEQRWKIPAVVNSCRVSCTGHPEVFIDGWCGDNVTVHCRDLPVAIRNGDPDHQPGQKPQKEGQSFHYLIHAPLFRLSNRAVIQREKHLIQTLIPSYRPAHTCGFVGAKFSVCQTNCQQPHSEEETKKTQINDSFQIAHLWWHLLFLTLLNLFKDSECLLILRANRDRPSRLPVRDYRPKAICHLLTFCFEHCVNNIKLLLMGSESLFGCSLHPVHDGYVRGI